MENEKPLPPDADESPRAIVPGHEPNSIFMNELGLRAGWRIVSYLLLILVLSTAINVTLDKMFHVPKTKNPSAAMMMFQECLLFAVVFLPACFMGWIERRPVGKYGLPARSAFGIHFWQGCLLGLVEISVLIAAIASFRGYHFGSLSEHGTSIWKWALFWALFFVVVGLFEEFAFRGYLQFTLADGIGFWPAACVLSLGFGLLHRLNPGETWTGAASVAMIALIFALALKRTGNLWFVVGWHAAFDFGETFLFSVPNSGGVFEGHLSNATMAGPEWLTGGSVGPEGSIFSFLTMAVAAFAIHKLFPAKVSELPIPEDVIPPALPSQ
jgi:membrane protease YdiL (CAAX protease family)